VLDNKIRIKKYEKKFKKRRNVMRVLANILWHFPFCGFMTALTAYIVGGLFFISVIGAPIGLGLFQFGKFLLAPFSYSMVSKKDLNIEQNKAWKTFGIIATII